MEKIRHRSMLWKFWPWYFRKGCLGPSSSSGSPDKFGPFSPGFRSPSYWLRTPNFIWQCINIHRPQWKDTRGSWLKDTGVFSVERHLVVPPWWSSGKESTCQCIGQGFDPWMGKIHWRRAWQSTPVFLPGESCGQRSLMDFATTGLQRVRHNWNDLAWSIHTH